MDTLKGLGWGELVKIIARLKKDRERAVAQAAKKAASDSALQAENLRIQADQRQAEEALAAQYNEAVKLLAEAETAKKIKADAESKQAAEEAKAAVETQEQVTEQYKEKRKALNKKVEEVKLAEEENKKEDAYLPIKKAAKRIIHLLERRDAEEEIKSLAKKELNANDRELIRQAALTTGAWYSDWVAVLFQPPISTKKQLNEYRQREQCKRNSDQTKENNDHSRTESSGTRARREQK